MEGYKEIATKARKKVLRMIHLAGTSHIGSNFSCIDILTVLYSKVLKETDKMIYSKGWVAASAYYFLSEKKIIPKKDLKLYCKNDSPYIGLLEPTVKGIDSAGGSMGYGLPFGVGFALAKKLQGEKGKVYVLMSDGEQAIGTTYESALIAAHHKLDNLVVIIDYNGFQAMGRTNEVLNIESLEDKWKSFGWETRTVDGHDYKKIESCLTYPPLYPEAPLVIIAHTIKGKGVSFMENLLDWHYKNVDTKDYLRALKELNALT